jgi:hypothetical protein
MSNFSGETRTMTALYDLLQEARARLESDDRNAGIATFEIIASFNAHHGDMKVMAKCYLSGGISESHENVELPFLSDAVDELMRRFDHKRCHAPICLPRHPTTEPETEADVVPF